MRQAGLIIRRVTLLAALFLATTTAADGESVARVTDLMGVATLQDGDGGNLRVLSRVRAGSDIRLDPGSHITLHFPANRTDYRFQGPNTIRVARDAAFGSQSAADIRQHNDIGVSLDTGDTDLGAIAMRSLSPQASDLRLLRPVDTVVLISRPTDFHWQSGESFDEYQFTLVTASGYPVISLFTDDTSIHLPHGTRLSPGTSYRWTVRADAKDGRSIQATGEFSSASTDTEARFFRLATLNGGDISNRVLYSLYLDAMGLHLEAESARRDLEPLRPGISGGNKITE
jgi:hypothetical protein